MALKNFLSILSSSSAKGDKKFISWIKSITGYSPKNTSLYIQAFNHSSILNKNNSSAKISNERLEFLGDAVLGAIIAEYLFNIFPLKDEGFLTQLRSKIVNGHTLRELSLKFGFNAHLKTNLTKEEKIKSSAFGDAFEAFVGAVYLDQGYIKTKKFIISKVVSVHLDLDDLVKTNEDYKSQLQIYCQKNKFSLEYRLISEEKNGTHKLYVVEVIINEKPYIRFESYSKRVAEQKAAQLTLIEIQKSIG